MTATVKRRADLILPGDVIPACPQTGDRQVRVAAVELPVPNPVSASLRPFAYVRLHWDVETTAPVQWYTAALDEELDTFPRESERAARTASVPARDLRAGDVLASGGATDGCAIVAVESFWDDARNLARVAVLLSGHAPQTVDSDFPVTIRPRDPREADPFVSCGAIREGWDDASCTLDPGHGGDHDPPHAHRVQVWPSHAIPGYWGWRCMEQGCPERRIRSANTREEAEAAADAHRWRADVRLNPEAEHRAALFPKSAAHTVDLWSLERGTATTWGWTCRDCPATGSGYPAQGIAVRAADKAQHQPATPPHTANTQTGENEEEERDADTQQADTASRVPVGELVQWAREVQGCLDSSEPDDFLGHAQELARVVTALAREVASLAPQSHANTEGGTTS